MAEIKKKCANCGYHGMIGQTVWCDYIGYEGVSREFFMKVKAPRPGRACRLWKSKADVKEKLGFNQNEILTEPEEVIRTYRGLVGRRAYQQLNNRDGAELAVEARRLIREGIGRNEM